MKILRRILFYLFTIIYLIGCPLIILYVLGRAYSPATNSLVKTGLVYLSSAPQLASVYLNNNLTPNKTPTTLRELPVGEYSIKLILDGYRPFEKKITVRGGKAIRLDRILLLPEEWKKENLSTLTFEELIPLENTPLILVRKGSLMKDLFILQLYEGLEQALRAESILPAKDSSPKPLLKNDSPYSSAKILNIFTVEGSPVLIFQISANRQESFLWMKAENNDVLFMDISALFLQSPQKILWDPDDEKNIFFLQNNNISRLNIHDKALYPKIITNVRSYTIFSKEIYTLLLDSTFKKWDYKGAKQEPPANIASILPIAKTKDDIAISVPRRNIVLFSEENGSLLLNQPPFKIAEHDIKGFKWNDKHQKLLIWTKNKIGSVDLGLTESDPAVPVKESSIQWIVTGKKNINQVFWAYNESHIVYTDSNVIYLAETDTSGKSAEAQIAELKKGKYIYYSDLTGKVYYLEPKTNHLVSIEILPPHSIVLPPVSDEINSLEGKQKL